MTQLWKVSSESPQDTANAKVFSPWTIFIIWYTWIATYLLWNILFSASLICFHGRAAQSSLSHRLLTERDVKINPALVCLQLACIAHIPEGWKTLLDTCMVSLGWKCEICEKRVTWRLKYRMWWIFVVVSLQMCC